MSVQPRACVHGQGRDKTTSVLVKKILNPRTDVVSVAAEAAWLHYANVVPNGATSSGCQGMPPMVCQ
jgi:hypothetical protein